MALIKCRECGKEISDTADRCIHCGYSLKSNYANNSDNKNRNAFAVVGAILGFCSIIAWLIPLFGIICTIAGLICSICGIRSANKPFAIVGLVFNVLSLILSFINLFYVFTLNVLGMRFLI